MISLCLSSELRWLRSDFRVEYGYSAATRIGDPDAFAVWLGINFALALDKSAYGNAATEHRIMLEGSWQWWAA